jgi:hypothetical protein
MEIQEPRRVPESGSRRWMRAATSSLSSRIYLYMRYFWYKYWERLNRRIKGNINHAKWGAAGRLH